MKRIVIIGASGVGKSTLARALGDILQIEVIHLDSLFWRTGWKKVPRKKQIAIQRQLVQKDAWIIDGSYHNTLGSRIKAADTVIFLDMPPPTCIWRVIKRHLTARSRPDLPKQCQDKLDWNYLVKVGSFPRRDRKCLIEHIYVAHESGKQIIWLRSRSDVVDYLRCVHEEVREKRRQPVAVVLVSV